MKNNLEVIKILSRLAYDKKFDELNENGATDDGETEIDILAKYAEEIDQLYSKNIEPINPLPVQPYQPFYPVQPYYPIYPDPTTPYKPYEIWYGTDRFFACDTSKASSFSDLKKKE